MVYCTATTQCSSCNQGDVGWMRIANFDMSDPNQDCPQGFKQFSTPTWSCERTLSRGGCQSMHFKTQGVEYSKICGRVIGYQVGSTSGFYTLRLPSVIDNAYIEGVSITHGSTPRKHIWSFATALQSVRGSHGPIHVCPCANSDSRMGQYIPSFVGNDYLCDSGNHAVSPPSTAVTHRGMAMIVPVEMPAVLSIILHGSLSSFLNLPQTILKSACVLMKLPAMRIHPSGWSNSMQSNNYLMTHDCDSVAN